MFPVRTLTDSGILQLTFFVTVLAIDGDRQSHDRMDILCCIEQHEPAASCGIFKGASFTIRFNRMLGRLLNNSVVKVLVLLIGAGLTSMGILGCMILKASADPNNFIPQDSYLIGLQDTGYALIPGGN